MGDFSPSLMSLHRIRLVVAWYTLVQNRAFSFQFGRYSTAPCFTAIPESESGPGRPVAPAARLAPTARYSSGFETTDRHIATGLAWIY